MCLVKLQKTETSTSKVNYIKEVVRTTKLLPELYLQNSHYQIQCHIHLYQYERRHSVAKYLYNKRISHNMYYNLGQFHINIMKCLCPKAVQALIDLKTHNPTIYQILANELGIEFENSLDFELFLINAMSAKFQNKLLLKVHNQNVVRPLLNSLKMCAMRRYCPNYNKQMALIEKADPHFVAYVEKEMAKVNLIENAQDKQRRMNEVFTKAKNLNAHLYDIWIVGLTNCLRIQSDVNDSVPCAQLQKLLDPAKFNVYQLDTLYKRTCYLKTVLKYPQVNLEQFLFIYQYDNNKYKDLLAALLTCRCPRQASKVPALLSHLNKVRICCLQKFVFKVIYRCFYILGKHYDIFILMS